MGSIDIVKFITLLLPFFSFPLYSQTINIKGSVKDAQTKENLIGATVQQLGQNLGGVANNFGVYHLTLQHDDTLKITIRSMGYQTSTKYLTLDRDTIIDFFLNPEVTTLGEVEIYGNSDYSSGRNTNTVTLPLEKMKELPAFVGEVDIIKAFQFMPGIQVGKEGTSGLFIRGGSPDQNLVLLDDVPLYAVNHIGGFFSIFDPNALKSVQLLKGGFPARYGGRLSSVLDVRLKEGNKQEHKNVLDIGLLSLRYAHEGPIKRDTSSFLFSIRRANLDLYAGIASLLSSNGLSRAGYTFYDINAKYHHKISGKDQVYVSFYGGLDRSFYRQKDAETNNAGNFQYQGKSIVQWGNLMGSFRWSHIYNKNLFSNLTLAYTSYHYFKNVEGKRIDKAGDGALDISKIDFRSHVRDWIAKIDYEYFPNSKSILRFGGSITSHDFNPGRIKSLQKGENITSLDTLYGSQMQQGVELVAYIEDQVQITDEFNINAGVNISSYYSRNETYLNPQPRILATYKVADGFLLNTSFSKMVQYLHLLSNTGTGIPIDLWVPVTDKVKPQSSWMYSIGSSKELVKDKSIHIIVDIYYKNFHNLIEFSEGSSFIGGASDWQDKVEGKGQGRAMGLELLLEKKAGRTSGWVSYTLSKNERRFENINNNKYFPYRYDRRHNFSMVAIHRFNPKVSSSATWQYASGDAITLTEGQYELYAYDLDSENEIGFNYFPAHLYSSRNGYRVQAFHRLDIGLNFFKESKKHTRIFRVGVYNVYNRLNPYYLYFARDGGKNKLYKISLFPIMPSFSWTWEFK